MRGTFSLIRCLVGLLICLAFTTHNYSQDTPTSIPQPTTAPQVTPNLDALSDVVIAYFEISTPRPQTGESFTLDFIVRVPSGTELVELPTFTDGWGDFDVQSIGEMQTETLPHNVTLYRQTLTVRLWQPRDYPTPETFVGYRLSGFNQTQRVPAQAAQITVPTVLDFNDLTLRPFKPLIDLPYTSPLVYIAGLAAALGLVGLGYRRWQRRPLTIAPEPLPLSPAETALASLAALKTRTTLTATERYVQISEILRVYTEARFGIGFTETSETITTLRDHLPEKALIDLSRILAEADLVKFAGVQPDEVVAGRLMDFARRWVMNAEKSNRQDAEITEKE